MAMRCSSLSARPAVSGQPLRASRAARPAAPRASTVTRAEKKPFDMFKLAGGRGLDMGEVRACFFIRVPSSSLSALHSSSRVWTTWRQSPQGGHLKMRRALAGASESRHAERFQCGTCRGLGVIERGPRLGGAWRSKSRCYPWAIERLVVR